MIWVVDNFVFCFFLIRFVFLVIFCVCLDIIEVILKIVRELVRSGERVRIFIYGLLGI